MREHSTAHTRTHPLPDQFPERPNGPPPPPLASAVGEGVGGGFLGKNAKYSAGSRSKPFIDPETGEIQQEKPSFLQARAERFLLQSAARRLLPDSRTRNCLRLRQKSQQIQVIQSKEHQKASYKGLQTCGSVWACPVCAAKISERRRAELKMAMDQHQASGGDTPLLTLTHPHHVGDDLNDLLSRQAKALSYFNGDRASRKVFEAMGCIGQIRALEVTQGRKRKVSNGWHPHPHVLLFVKRGLDLAYYQQLLSERWIACCVRAGLKPPSLEHGLKLDDGSYAASYVSKWGLESEMTKGHLKKAKDGETPFDLLRAYANGSDKQAGALFIEFAKAFKGKRQLHWSRGLKTHFQIGEMTDEELANQQDDKAILLATITLDQWRYILKIEARTVVLELAEQGREALDNFLNSIPSPDHLECKSTEVQKCKSAQTQTESAQ